MKKSLLIAIFSAACFVCVAQNMTDVANLKRYAEQNKGIAPGQVVFIGNSITDAWPRHSPEFFEENGYVGRGISGQTSSQLLLRFRQDVIDLKPVAVVINIGTNDIALNSGPYNQELTLWSIKSMAEIADNNGIKVILSSVLPVKEYPWRKEVKDVPQQIDMLNMAIKSYAVEKGFAYIDYNSLMRAQDGGMILEYANDGVHPTKAGYLVMGEAAHETIRKVLGQKKGKNKRDSKKSGFAVGVGMGVSF